MSKAGVSVLLTSTVVLVYVIISTLEVQFGIVFLSMLLSQALLIWMVITILKDKRKSTRTFDEYFYEDVDIRRSQPADK